MNRREEEEAGRGKAKIGREGGKGEEKERENERKEERGEEGKIN